MIRARDGSREHKRLGDKVFQNPEQRKLKDKEFFLSSACAEAEAVTICNNSAIGCGFFFCTLKLIAKLILLQSDIAVKNKVVVLYSI